MISEIASLSVSVHAIAVSYSDLFYLLTVAVERYCSTRSNSSIDTHPEELLWTGGSVRRRDLYLTTNNIHKGHTSMSPAGFEPTIPAGERPLGSAAFDNSTLTNSANALHSVT